MVNTTCLAIATELGVLLWLATDHFVLLLLGALVGLALGLGLKTDPQG